MYFKIALHNVKKSLKDYTIYFLTLTFGICLFYLFNSIHSQQAMLEMNESQRKMMELVQTMISGISIFVAVILGLLIIYANQYLMKRRHKEMGIYLLLGMEKRQVSRILILETLLIGIFALAAGLAAGIFLAQGFSILTARMFAVEMKEFQFVFSQEAFLQTILYFVIIFVIVMLFNSISISKYKIIDLIHAGKKNQKLRLKSLWQSIVIFVISIACIGFGYYNIIENGMLELDLQFRMSIVCGFIGTFLFFFSLSGFMLNLARVKKSFYYKGLNIFIFRQIHSKITTTFLSMTMLCLMLFLAICAFATGTGMAKTVNSDLEKVTPYDYSFYLNADEEGNIKNQQELLKDLEREGIEIEAYADSIQSITLYTQTEGKDRNLTMAPFLEGREDLCSFPGDEVDRFLDGNISVIKLSDYNRFLKSVGKKPIKLGKNQYAVSCNYENVRDAYEEAVEDRQEITLNGKKMKPLSYVLEDCYTNSSIQMDAGSIVAADDIVNQLQVQPVYRYVNIMWKASSSDYSKTLSKKLDRIYKNEAEGGFYENTPYSADLSREDVYEQGAGLSAIVTYVAIYIGMVFLITSAAVLALQQLSENNDNIPKYRLLEHIGTDEKMIRGAIKSQIIIYFLIPMSLALVHSYVGIKVASELISTMGHMDIVDAVLKSMAVLLIIYGGYMIATYFGSKSMLKSKNE
nr:ABC transporter permease [uncultured Anaerostipes sp.]